MLSLESAARKKAVAYYRHSAEDKQENSVPIQREHAQKFAVLHNLDIIHEEADEGKSGLLASRPGFERLFDRWITDPSAPHFDYVLVYDVSHWGRFQDQDEAAYYEFRCKQRGKKVIYVSRGFPKEEEQLISHLQTSIERYMAAEYSRQLSDKVFYGCVKVSEQGYSAGGTACYGMVRVLLDEHKQPIRLLERGEHKQISNQRVTFAPRGDATTEAVKTAFRLLVEEWKTLDEIAGHLNETGIRSASGGLWNSTKVLNILTNETYTGTRLYNKTWGRLKQGNRPNPRSEWVVKDDAFPAVVDHGVFSRAQESLYWQLPSRWRRGIRTSRKAYRFVKSEFQSVYNRLSDPHENTLFDVLMNLPIAISVTFYRDSIRHWCFRVSEETHRHEKVLGIGLRIDLRDPLDAFFLFPTNRFSSTNWLVLAENDPEFESLRLSKDQVHAAITEWLNNAQASK